MDTLTDATAAISDGKAIVYPTDTVYGLGADALAPESITRVFEIKARPRTNPISLAVPSVQAATEYVTLSDREREFMETFLPGPVTVVCQRRSTVPPVLTAGSDRVGVRIPDHDLAIRLLEQTGPLTATSANRTGEENARTPTAVSTAVREQTALTVDGGTTPGGESTVVDVARNEIHRPGRCHDAVTTWLADQ